VVRENLHPADHFEAFRRLSDEHGFGAEEIAARFGVTPQVLRQRLRLGAVSPKLMQVYREGGLTLDQLMAFAVTWTRIGGDQDAGKPLSDTLVRDLMAHRTLGLRIALGESPDMALLAVTHALAARTFFRGEDDGSCLDIRPNSAFLGGHAEGVADTAAAQRLTASRNSS